MSELTNRAQTAADSLEALAAEVEWAGGHRQAVRALQDARDSALAASAFLEATDKLDLGAPVPSVDVTPREWPHPPMSLSRLDRLDGVQAPTAAGAAGYVVEAPLRPCWDVIVAWLCLLGALVLLVVGFDGVINGYEALAFVLVTIGLAGLASWVLRR